MRYGRQIFRIHSWLGLASGLFILVFFLTGSILTFREELNNFENSHLFRVTPQVQRLPYRAVYQQVREQEPNLYLYSFRYIPRKPTETLEMRIYDPTTQEYGLLYVNPYTGKVLGKTFRSTYDVLLKLHYTFYLGRVGELLAAIFALVLLGSLITGFWIYRKFIGRVLTLRVSLKWKNWRTASSDLHRILGVWALGFNFILAFSGFYMVKYAFNLPSHFAAPAKILLPPEFSVNLDLLIKKAQEQVPGMALTLINFPRQPGDPLEVCGDLPGNWLYGDFQNRVQFNYQTSALQQVFREQELSKTERLEYALYTLHYGQYGGTGIKLLYSFLALASAVVTITGFMLWTRKRFKTAPKLRPAINHLTTVNNSKPIVIKK